VDGALTVDNFAFRSATPVLELEPGKSYAIGVALSTSMLAADAITSFNVALPAGNYVVFANGFVQQGFAPNPSGSEIGFMIFPISNVRTSASSESNIDFVVLHGVTDALAVDVRAGGSNIVSALAYSKTSDYISVPAADYVVDVAPTGGAPLVSYNVPGIALKGQSTVVFASGVQNIPLTMNAMSAGGYVMVIDAGTHRSVVPFTIVR
jgi:hypothetical protein